MQKKLPLERMSVSKRKSLVIGLIVAAVAFASLAFLMVTNAGRFPAVINETFDQDASARFDVINGGQWVTANGVYELRQPASLSDEDKGNSNMSIAKKPITASEWRLEAEATLRGDAARDFSLVYDYVDEANYYFVNVSRQGSGIYKLERGSQKRLASFSFSVVPNKKYEVELRKDGREVKVYLDEKYIAKSKEGASYSSMRIGFGSRSSAVAFDNLYVGADGVVTNPTPVPTPTPTPVPPTAPPIPTPTPTPDTKGDRQVKVSNGDQLTAALDDARPGDVITMADGVYTAKKSPSVYIGRQNASAKFRMNERSGTSGKPIVLQGSRNAVIDGESTGGDYGLHIFKSSHWVVKGIRVTNAKKGIMLDGSSHVTLDGVMVDEIGHEGVHFRTNSSDNVLRKSYITKVGLNNPNYGEGVYLGSSDGNWGTLNGGKADESDRNQVVGNTITGFKAEGIDLKEASSNNLIKGNYFDGSAMGIPKGGSLVPANSGDSWIDVKGDGNLITENKGDGVPVLAKDSAAFQVHTHGPSGYNSASNNTFSKNIVRLSRPGGYGFSMYTGGKNNTVTCDNVVGGSVAGFGYNGFACNS